MNFWLMKLPFRIVGWLFSRIFTVAILELFGLLFYGQWRHPAAIQRLFDSLSPGAVVGFVTGSPDRIVVAVLLALVGLALAGSSGSSSTSYHPGAGEVGGDGGGFFGGDGGDGGGFGGDGGGGDGGGGGGGE